MFWNQFLFFRLLPVLGVIVVFGSLTTISWAKRAAPAQVSETAAGYLFEAVPFSKNRLYRYGGMVRCSDAASGKVLWELQVYNVKARDRGIEEDVVDVFISAFKLDGSSLWVKNENGDEFLVDIETKKVEWTVKGNQKRDAEITVSDAGATELSTPVPPEKREEESLKSGKGGCSVVAPGA